MSISLLRFCKKRLAYVTDLLLVELALHEVLFPERAFVLGLALVAADH
jgi:hypothetical protein